MARTFDQVYAELGSAYDPSAAIYQQQVNAIPQQTDALIAQTDAKKDQAFTDIVDSARRRGVGFWGIPSAEQAEYASTEYAPAIANLKSSAQTSKLSLLEAINSLNRDRRTQAQSVFEGESARDLQERQFQESIRQYNESLAAQRAATAASNASSDPSKYLTADTSTSAGTTPQVTASEQAIYNRAKSLQSVFNSDPGVFNSTVKSLLRKGDDTSKQVILNAYKLLGMGNAQSLKNMGLI